MGFPASLGIGLSALTASQAAVNTISHNIANSSVAGYTRQTVNITSSTPTPGTPGDRGSGMYGTGVEVVSVTRMRDQLADISYRSQAATSGAANAQSQVLDNAQQVLGSLDTGTPADLSNFYASWTALSTTPTDASARQGVIDAGTTVANDLNSASQQLTNIADDAGVKMSSDVTTINNLTTQVASLNQQILSATAAGTTPNDLMDTRDNALDQLSSLTGATISANSDGTDDVFIGTQPIVRGNTSNAIAISQSGNTYTVSMAADPTKTLNPGGEMGGYLDVVNNTLPSLKSQLDDVAANLISTVNTAHQNGYDINGNPGQPFFSGTDASSISVSSAITPDTIAAASVTNTPNDGNNALAISQLRSQKVNSTGTVADNLGALAARFGSVASSADQTATAASTSLSGYAQSRASSDGVSVDQEMVNMLQYQQTYQAAAKIISTTDTMMDTLINGMGVGS